MKKYEYKIITIKADHLVRNKFQEKLDQNFNAWGYEGWNLANIEPITSGGLFWGANTDKFLIIFKREKTD